MKSLKKADIEALRKVMPVLEETEQRTVIGGSGFQSGVVFYTEAEFDSMYASGTWDGGYVEGWGYTCAGFCIFPSGNTNSGSADLMSFAQYLTFLSNSGFNQVAESALGMMSAGLTDYYIHEFGDAHRDMQSSLLQLGYNASSYFYIGCSPTANGGSKLTVYDARNGYEITSRTLSIVGTWQ